MGEIIMNNLMIHMTIDNYIELVERSREAGIKEGESMQEVLDLMIKEGKIKTIIKTTRSVDEIKNDLKKHWKIWEVNKDETDA